MTAAWSNRPPPSRRPAVATVHLDPWSTVSTACLPVLESCTRRPGQGDQHPAVNGDDQLVRRRRHSSGRAPPLLAAARRRYESGRACTSSVPASDRSPFTHRRRPRTPSRTWRREPAGTSARPLAGAISRSRAIGGLEESNVRDGAKRESLLARSQPRASCAACCASPGPRRRGSRCCEGAGGTHRGRASSRCRRSGSPSTSRSRW